MNINLNTTALQYYISYITTWNGLVFIFFHELNEPGLNSAPLFVAHPDILMQQAARGCRNNAVGEILGEPAGGLEPQKPSNKAKPGDDHA